MSPDDVVARLILALDHGDEVALARLLHPDVAIVVDTGDRAGGETRGRARVVGWLIAFRMAQADASLEAVHLNGEPGIAARRSDGAVVGALVIGVADRGGVHRLWLVTASGKLAHWSRLRPLAE